MKKIKVENLGKEEYWSEEQECPYCKHRFMHRQANFCRNCGKSFKNVEWTYD